MQLEFINKELGISGVLNGVDADLICGKSGDLELPSLTIECISKTDTEMVYRIQPTIHGATLRQLMDNVGKVKNVIVQKATDFGPTGTGPTVVVGFSVFANPNLGE